MGIEDIYKSFITQINDEVLFSLDEEGLKEEMNSMLLSAIPKFRYPKIDLSLEDGAFVEDLGSGEVQILADLMVLEWIDRQVQTIRLTEVHYTSADAKALNTASQLRALNDLKDAKNRELNRFLQYYQTNAGEKNSIHNLGGKNVFK